MNDSLDFDDSDDDSVRSGKRMNSNTSLHQGNKGSGGVGGHTQVDINEAHLQADAQQQNEEQLQMMRQQKQKDKTVLTNNNINNNNLKANTHHKTNLAMNTLTLFDGGLGVQGLQGMSQMSQNQMSEREMLASEKKENIESYRQMREMRVQKAKNNKIQPVPPVGRASVAVKTKVFDLPF
jgi:hypothetical protein